MYSGMEIGWWCGVVCWEAEIRELSRSVGVWAPVDSNWEHSGGGKTVVGWSGGDGWHTGARDTSTHTARSRRPRPGVGARLILGRPPLWRPRRRHYHRRPAAATAAEQQMQAEREFTPQ